MAFQQARLLSRWLSNASKIELSGLRLRVAIFTALCGIAAGLIVMAGPRLFITQSATLTFDMEISAGSTVGLFVNRFDRAPARTEIVAGSRRIYAFGGITSDIAVMRLDPSDQVGATIKLYGVSVDDESGALRRFIPGDIARWGQSGLQLTETNAEYVSFVSTGTNPYLLVGNVVSLRRGLPIWLTSLLADASTYRFFAPLFVFGFALLLFATLLEANRGIHLLLALSTTLVVITVVPWLSRAADNLPSLSHAVGRAAFFGSSTRGNSIAVLMTGVASILIATVAGLMLRPARDAELTHSNKAPSAVCVGLGVAGILLLMIPDLGRQINDTAHTSFTPDWDGNNILVWDWLVHEGYRPLRDFWYPYGGFYLFSLPLPWGIVMSALYRAVVHAMLFVVVTKLTKQPFGALSLTVFVFLGEGVGLLPGAWRYLLVLTVALSYLIIREDRLKISSRILFWSSCVMTCLFEPVQLVYAAPPIALILAIDIWQQRAWQGRLVLARLIRDFGVPAAATAIYILGVFVAGQGQGFIDFYGGLGDATVYAAEPTDLVGALDAPLSIRFVGLAAPFAFLAIGLGDRLRQRRPDMFADVMIALGAVGIMMLQKHLVRPIDWQLFLVNSLALALYLMFWWHQLKIVGQAIAGIILGASIAVLIQVGAMSHLSTVVFSTPQRFAGSIEALLGSQAWFASLNNGRFSGEKFNAFKDEKAVAADLIARSQNGRTPTVFVLGDSPIVYILINQKPPYHVNDYNASPIYEQRKVAEFLNREKPPVIIWDPNTQSFDLFQSVVRNPLTYNAVVSMYVPDRVVGRFQVLRRRTPDEPIALDFWRNRLGSVVTLGHLARVSSFSSMAPCKDATSDCQELLVVKKRNPVFAGRIVVGVNVGGRHFEVAMQTVAGDSELHVSLERLWFWGPMKMAGLEAHVESDPSSETVDVTIRNVARRDDLLY